VFCVCVCVCVCLFVWENINVNFKLSYQVADKSLAQPTSRCILFDGENISFDANLVICI